MLDSGVGRCNPRGLHCYVADVVDNNSDCIQTDIVVSSGNVVETKEKLELKGSDDDAEWLTSGRGMQMR